MARNINALPLAVLKALGLEGRRITSLSIDMPVGKIPTVTLTEVILDNDELAEVFSRFYLLEIDTEQAS